MNCKQFQKNIFKFLEKDLTADAYQEMQEHLQSCGHCQSLTNELEMTMHSMFSEKVTEPDPFFFTRLEAKMESAPDHVIWKVIRLLPVLRYAAASVAILLSVVSGKMLGAGFRDQGTQATEEAISYIDSYTNDYYMFEMDDEIIETVLLNR